MTMTGGTWTPTTVTPAPGAGPLTASSAVLDIMQWLADNNTGDISALDLRNSFDLVFSLLTQTGGRVTTTGVAGQIPGVRGGGVPAPGVNVYPWNPGYTPSVGELFLNTPDGTTWVYDGNNWIELGGAGGIHYVADQAALAGVRATPSDIAIAMDTGNLYRIGTTYIPAPTNEGGTGVWSTKHVLGTPPAAPGMLSVLGGNTLIIGDASQGGVDTVDQTKMAVGDEFWLVDTQDPTRWDHYAIDSLMGADPFSTHGTHGYTIHPVASGTNGGVPAGADVRLFYNYAEPTPQQGWELVGHIGYRVTVKDISGVEPTPTDPPKAFDGDVFINVTDKKFWIYGPTSAANPTPTWHQLSGGIKVTALANSGQAPTIRSQTPQGVVIPALPVNPNVGDLVVNTADKLTWLFDGTDWRLVAAAEPNIAVTSTAGDNPGTQPPAFTPRIGDLYINESDGSAWVWAHAPGGGGDIWQPLTPATGNVYVSDTAGDIPFAPAPGSTGQQQFQFPPRRPLNEGDRFVNRTDHISWVYGPDPSRPGQLTWIEVPTSTNAIATDTPGEVPFAPPTGATTLSQYQFARPSRVGDLFINTVDGKTWAYVDDPAGGGQIWQQLPPTTVIVAAARGDEPWTDARASDPTTGQALPTLSVGSMYVNPFNNVMYVVTDDGAGGMEWVQVSEHVRGTKVTVFDTAGEFPALISNPRIGDVAVNTVDRLAWIYGDLNGISDWQPIAEPNTIVVAMAADDDPWTDARTSDPATGDIVDGLVVGDMYVNPFSTEAYIVVDDGSGPTWVQISGKPQSAARVTASDTTGATPTTLTGISHKGDVFINRKDGTAWVYGTDPAGTDEWVVVPHPMVTVGKNANDIPNGGAVTTFGTFTFQNWGHGATADGEIAYNTEVHIRDVDATGAAPAAAALAMSAGTIQMTNTADPNNVVTFILGGAFTHDTAAHVWKAPVMPLPASGNTAPRAGQQYVVAHLGAGHAVAGTRDDVYYNEYDHRMWIHDGTAWVEILLANGALLVPNEAARLALATPPSHIPDGTLVVQQDTGWTWRYQASYTRDPFWSPWRVFSDYVGAVDIAARDALAKHIHIGTLVSVGPAMYQYVANPNTATGQPPGVFVDFGRTLNPPGLEGIIVPAAAPADPGTVKWAGVDATALAAVAPGSYFVVADATTPVPAGVPNVAGQPVKAGDWLVAVDADGDGTSDTFHLVSLPTGGRPLVTVVTTKGTGPAGALAALATWVVEGHAGAPATSGGRIHVNGGLAGAAITEVGFSETTTLALAPAAGMLANALVPGATVHVEDSTNHANWFEYIVDAVTTSAGQIVTTVVAGSVKTGGTAPIPAPGATNINVVVTAAVPVAGQRDDVLYNSADQRMWIHDGTKWVELFDKQKSTTLQLYATVPATNPPDNAMTFNVYQARGWADFPVGAYAVVREAPNGVLPHMSGLPNLSGLAATPGDWLVNLDTDGNGVTDKVVLVRQQAAQSFRHKTNPTEAPRIYLDRGLALLGITTTDDAAVNDGKIGGSWDIFISGECRSTTDLSLIFHTGAMTTAMPTDEPWQTIDGKTALGPWHVKAQTPWAITIKGITDIGYNHWVIEFTGQDENGKRTFDRVAVLNANGNAHMPAIGVDAAAGNVYVQAAFILTKES